MSARSILGLTKHSFGAIFLPWNGGVEFTDEFSHWWDGLTEAEQVDVNAKVILLQKVGPGLPRPHADLIHSSRHPNMKEAVSGALCF